MKCSQNSSTSGTAAGNAADLSVIDTSSGGATGNSSCSIRTGHISGLRGAYQQASDYGNINRGAVKVPA